MIGRLIAAGSNVIATPIVLHAIGREGFGVVTFTFSLNALFAILDLGLAATANRAVAQAATGAKGADEQANLLRTFEFIYWAGAAAIIVVMFAVSGWVARDWLQLNSLRPSDAAFVVGLTGMMLGLRFPVNLYSGVLFGLRRHDYQNLIFGGFSAVRYLGGAALVVFVSPSVLAYSKWLALTGLGEVIATAIAAWALIGGRRSFWTGRFTKEILARHWRFSLVFAATGVIGSLIASLDRLVIGKILPVSELGLYGLLYTPAGVLTMISTALGVASFPEFSAATVASDRFAARELFARTQMLTTVCILAIAIPLGIHFGPVLRIWTQDHTIARDGLVPGVLLLAALAVNALTNPAYTFLVASGRPRIALVWNFSMLPVTGACLFWIVPRMGLTGAAMVVFIIYTLGLTYYLFQASRLLTLNEALYRGFGKASLVVGSLSAGNLAIAAVCQSDELRIGLSFFFSSAIGYLFFMKLGLLQQFMRQPPEP